MIRCISLTVARLPRFILLCCSVLILCALVAPSKGAEVVDTDICVYGGTAGGVAAAVQAARMGKSVVLVEPRNHIGGMTSGGLGHTDTGNIGAIGGISREFYRRVGQRYGQGESFSFEPKVAEQTLNSLLQEAGVPVYFWRRLASVNMDGQRLREIVMENGDVFRARMFIDTTYEGDLMAAAGVTFTWGRESVSTYGESLNGIRASTPSHQFVVNVDPYFVPGDSTSGLLPYISPEPPGAAGDGDQKLQAYNYRMCLTQTASNRMAITAPTNYSAANYELLARYIQARLAAGHSLNLRSFLKIDSMPNGKTDINNQGGFSTDFIGMNYTYATNTWPERERIWREHENYIRGLFHFLGNDSRVPESIRNEMNSWGLPRDEFQDTGGWPHQLYVREARRMISDYIMLQQNCQGSRVANDSVGLASYTMDSHNIQRVLQNGFPRNEGDVQVGVPAPYPISYRSIVPRVGECENLFVTFALSASHMGFGSCRMEPVHMITSQSAATAAAIAINDNVPVQQVSYPRLRAQLLADKQLLVWGSSAIDPSGGIIVDSEDATGVIITGNWTNSVGAPGYHGLGYLHDQNTAKGELSVRLTPDLPTAGEYSVYLRWTENANRAPNVPVTLVHQGGITNFVIDQRTNGGIWHPLGKFNFDAGTAGSLLIENAGTTGFVIADSALWLPPTAPFKLVEVFASDPEGSENTNDTAQLTFWRSGDIAGDLTVFYSVSGTATPNLDFFGTAASVVIPAGQVSVSVKIIPVLDTNLESSESVMVTIEANEAYEVGPSNTATVMIHENAFDAWRVATFSAGELEFPSISGAEADPENDGIPNLLEFVTGGDPFEPGSVSDLSILRAGTNLTLALKRQASASTIGIALETSSNLTNWAAWPGQSQGPVVVRTESHQELRYAVTDTAADSRFWRARFRQPLPPGPVTHANFFFSFDALPNGTGAYTEAVTANAGFPGQPAITRSGTTYNVGGAGGAANFTDYRGTNWTGSGGSSVPGHSLGWNPGSTGNSMNLTFSTLGLGSVQLRCDIRSAAAAGGTPPTRFDTFTYDIGNGPQPVPGVVLTFPADNTFRAWTADLSALAAIENQSSVTLRWTFEDLANTPSPIESLRIDNIQVNATALQ